MIRNVIFDFGNVLVDWSPYYLFLPHFGGDRDKTDWFINNVCNREWFTRIDQGEKMDDCVKDLQQQFPDWTDSIALFRDRWFDMCHGPIPGMMEIINHLKADGIGVYGLTNWPAETFQEARQRYCTIAAIENYVVSSAVGHVKPQPEIYRILMSRYNLKAEECLFVDDRPDNVNAARALRMQGMVFKGSADELDELLRLTVFQGR